MWNLSTGSTPAQRTSHQRRSDGAQHTLYRTSINPNALSMDLGAWGRGRFNSSLFRPLFLPCRWRVVDAQGDVRALAFVSRQNISACPWVDLRASVGERGLLPLRGRRANDPRGAGVERTTPEARASSSERPPEARRRAGAIAIARARPGEVTPRAEETH